MRTRKLSRPNFLILDGFQSKTKLQRSRTSLLLYRTCFCFPRVNFSQIIAVESLSLKLLYVIHYFYYAAIFCDIKQCEFLISPVLIDLVLLMFVLLTYLYTRRARAHVCALWYFFFVLVLLQIIAVESLSVKLLYAIHHFYHAAIFCDI